MARTFSVRLNTELAEKIKAIIQRERERNEREKRKPPTISEVLTMLIRRGIEEYYAEQ